MKVKRPTYTEFICTNCKCHEKIPTKIVLQMDMMDPGDPTYPPMFDCEKCGGLMKPVYFIGYTGIVIAFPKQRSGILVQLDNSNVTCLVRVPARFNNFPHFKDKVLIKVTEIKEDKKFIYGYLMRIV